MHASHQGGGCVHRHVVRLGHPSGHALGILKFLETQTEQFSSGGYRSKDVMPALVTIPSCRLRLLECRTDAYERLLPHDERGYKFPSGDLLLQPHCRKQRAEYIFTNVARPFVGISEIHGSSHWANG